MPPRVLRKSNIDLQSAPVRDLIGRLGRGRELRPLPERQITSAGPFWSLGSPGVGRPSLPCWRRTSVDCAAQETSASPRFRFFRWRFAICRDRRPGSTQREKIRPTIFLHSQQSEATGP